MSLLQMKIVSSLTKVFLDQEPAENTFCTEGFQNEVLSFQVAYTLSDPQITRTYVKLDVQSPVKDYIHIRQVEHVPARYAAPVDSDDRYLRKTPGLYPDLLRKISEYTLRARYGQWDSLWVEVKSDESLAAGIYPVTIRLTAEDGSFVEKTHNVTILNAKLPPQKLIHTKWFHCDCLAEYYHQDAFSEAHWDTIEKFIKKAVEGGINMILTPIHTPPLDTRVGGERLTTQLVDVFVENGKYRFDTQKLRRWIGMCKRCGVEYFEMAHLYTQWGAGHAPKIMATVDGKYTRIFGWETDSVSEEYRSFLYEYIPAVRSVLKEEGVDAHTCWHISDEPSSAQLDSYRAAREQVMPLLKDCFVMDALSSFDFYQSGAADHPVVASNHIQKFIDEHVTDLWTYYCCSQYKDVSNVFIAMPSARTRILAVQLFKYQIKGFLQWGFNFYNAQYSDHRINPFLTTDGDGFVPAGDTFQVYPGENGEPLESIRMAVTRDAMQDLRAFELLAELKGREYVTELIDNGLENEITFACYPADDEYLLTLRTKVNHAIIESIGRVEEK